MSLTEIEYGSVASSETVNNNFQYLDDKIASVSQSLSANTSTLSSSISSLSATVAANKESQDEKNSEFEENLAELEKCFERIYIKETYKSGSNWYRLYSDGWCEQGGYISTGGTNAVKTVTLPLELTDTSASVYASCLSAHTDGNWDIGVIGARFIDTKSIKISVGRDGAGGGAYWRVCGFVKE